MTTPHLNIGTFGRKPPSILKVACLLAAPAGLATCEACGGTGEIACDTTCGDCDPCIGGRPDQCAVGGRIERRKCEHCNPNKQ